jgi:hypothetical protein
MQTTLPESWRNRLLEERVPEILLVVAGLIIVAPLWSTLRPPIQDLPQHVAAVRVLSCFRDPSYRFQDYFTLTLGRTQYLTVYLLAALLAKVTGPIFATKAVLSLALLATPLALLRLVRALKRNPALAFFGLPFVFNVHVAYGFLNFVAAIPLLLLGLAIAVEQHHQPTRQGAVALSTVLIFCFLTHVVPFGLLVVASVMLTRWDKSSIVRQVIVLLPAVFVMGLWLIASPAGRVVSTLGRSSDVGQANLAHLPFDAALRMLPDWVIHISTGENEPLVLIIWLMMVLILLVLGVAIPSVRVDHDAKSSCQARLVVSLLVPISMLAYFTLPNGYAFIWPICQRFPVLALLLSVFLLAPAPKWALRIGATVSFVLAVVTAGERRELFRASSARGYSGFDEVVAQIPMGRKVAVLVFERQLEGLQLAPLIHAAGWVQAERGGVVMFSFAEFPSSPFAYRADRRPPPVAPRWEWGPDRVVPDRDLSWYDYCLVQGWSGNLEHSRRFKALSRHGRWSLWQRIDSNEPSPVARI